MSDYRLNICQSCGGKGFHWKRQFIIDNDTGAIKADIYREGERCKVCKGSGELGRSLHETLIWFAIWLAIIVFIIIPLTRFMFNG